MQRRSLLAAALAAFLPVRVPANPVPTASGVAAFWQWQLDRCRYHHVRDETWRVYSVRDDLWSRAVLEERGEWPPGPLRTGEIGRIDRFTIHTSEVL